MALSSCLACLLAMPMSASASRVGVQEAHDVPWRKAAVVGAVLSNRLADSAVGALEEQVVIEGSGSMHKPNGDASGRVQSLLLAAFSGEASPDEVSFGKLFDQLRGSQGSGDDVLARLEAKLSSPLAKKYQMQTMSDAEGRTLVQKLPLPPDDGGSGLVISRWPRCEHRTIDEVRNLQRLLWSVEQSKAQDGIFLRYFAQSHTASELTADTSAEVLLMSELPIGALRAALEKIPFDFEGRVRLIFDIYSMIHKMRSHRIPHRSDLTPDTVLVITDPVDPGGFNVAFSTIIMTSSADKMAQSADDRFNADVRQFGTLLRLIFAGQGTNDYGRKVTDVFLAFGKALEAGAYIGEERVTGELADLLRFVSDEQPEADLQRARILYLRAAVDAELAADSGPAGAAAASAD